MDALAELLEGVRARTAAFCQIVLEPPWALRIADEAPLALVTALHGHAWIVPDDGEPALIGTGDIAAIKGSHHYTVGDHPDTPPSIVVNPGDRLTTLDGRDVTAELLLASRSALEQQASGRPPNGVAIIASGTYRITGHISGRLLAALPRIIRVPSGDVRSPIMRLLAAELGENEPGQQVVLDRLLDLALISTLRAWFNREGADAPGWYRAHSDPIVGPALRAMHDDPRRPWTVASLAAAVGASRAAFARRFNSLVGQPPITYLTHWRLDRAADLLRDTDANVETIARQVGYANSFALSVAFKRELGTTPRQHRNGLTHSPDRNQRRLTASHHGPRE